MIETLQAGRLTCRQDCHYIGADHTVFSARFWLSAQPLVFRTTGYQNQSVHMAQYVNLHAPPMVTSYGSCLLQARTDLADKRPSLSGENGDIDAARARCDADNPVFYDDGIDIDLNPKLKVGWMFSVLQKQVATQGQHAKYFLARVLHAGNGRMLYITGIKNSSQFITMQEKPRHYYL